MACHRGRPSSRRPRKTPPRKTPGTSPAPAEDPWHLPRVKVTKSDGTVVENTYDVDGVLVRTSVNGMATDLLVETSGGLSHVVAGHRA
jgi:hypothetical protein